MKRLLIIATAFLMCSCSVQNQTLIPKAVNTTATAFFNELRLQRSDYQVLKTVTAEAAVSYSNNRQCTNVYIKGIDEDFELHYTYDQKAGWCTEYAGIIKLGYLNNDYRIPNSNVFSPEELARGLAIYRAINIMKQEGGDGLIEPIISTNVEQTDKRTVIFKSTVTAKIIKLKTDDELWDKRKK